MTKPYQPSFSIQPTYGFRYSSQPFAPNVGSINSANTGIIPDYEYKPDVKVPNKPMSPVTPQVMDSSSDDNNSEIAEASRQMSIDASKGKGEVYGPSAQGLVGALSPFGMSSLTGPAVPESGYGSPGSVSSLTGGVFNEEGRSVDPITGVANPEFATSRAFTDYIYNDPFANVFGDKDNAFRKSSDPSFGTASYQQAIQNSYKEGSPNAGMGTLSNQDKIMMKVGMDSGIPEHSLMKTRIEDDGTKTYLGTTKKGAQIKGQDLHLPTFGNIEGVEYTKDEAHGMAAKAGGSQAGVYNPDDSSPSLSGTTKSTAVSTSKGSYADDAQASSSGGGSSCCFIMLEARYGNGTMDNVVRRYRDEHMTIQNKRGYYKVASVLVPLMRKSKVFKWIITKTFADPLVCYGKWYYKENKYGWIFSPIKNFWLNLFEIVGTDTKFIKENGEIV